MVILFTCFLVPSRYFEEGRKFHSNYIGLIRDLNIYHKLYPKKIQLQINIGVVMCKNISKRKIVKQNKIIRMTPITAIKLCRPIKVKSLKVLQFNGNYIGPIFLEMN